VISLAKRRRFRLAISARIAAASAYGGGHVPAARRAQVIGSAALWNGVASGGAYPDQLGRVLIVAGQPVRPAASVS
jgi:hypothetical protein